MEIFKKKKVAFVLDGAIVGGIETALTQMLRKIDADKYEITLFTNIQDNPCIGQIPACIKIVDLDVFDLRTDFLNSLQRGNLFRVVKLLQCYLKLRLSKSGLDKVKCSQEPFVLTEKTFDCAIAYRANWICVLWVLNHINARKKAAWVHNAGWEHQKKHWIEYLDKLFCVSEDMKKYIECVCPKVIGRTEVLHNIIDSSEILLKAGDGHTFGKGITLVTVGRLASEKGQDMIPQTMRFLLDAGYQAKWYIVGDGSLRKTVEEKSRELGVTENIILTGTLSNPYPYMKGCNIYVQTSYEEGWCLTVQEAKILHKPIVTTDLPAMREQIVHMKNGYITEGISPEALVEGIKTLLDNPTLCEQFAEELKKESHDNTQELEKLYAFIES